MNEKIKEEDKKDDVGGEGDDEDEGEGEDDGADDMDEEKRRGEGEEEPPAFGVEGEGGDSSILEAAKEEVKGQAGPRRYKWKCAIVVRLYISSCDGVSPR